MSEVLAHQSLRKEHLRRPHDKKSTPAKQHGIWLENFKLKAEDKATIYSPVEIKAPVLVSKNTEERMFVVDSGASMHMLSKKDLSSDELDTLRRSRNPTMVVTATGEVQTNEEAQTGVRSRSRFVRHRAVTRRNASSSFAWFALLRTRMFILVENRRNSTLNTKWKYNYLYSGQLRTSYRTRIVIIFQQQFGFYIETKGSVQFFR